MELGVYTSFVLLFFSLLHMVQGQADQREKMKKYLINFGYIKEYTVNEKAVNVGIKRFQSFANLPVTGNLDAATVKQMSVPRCGLGDPVKNMNVTRKRRYNRQGTRGKKNLLTWRYEGGTQDLDRDTVRQTLTKAMKKWTDKTNIEFRESHAAIVDVNIKFVHSLHDDSYPFDGEGGTLAHAFYPGLYNQGFDGDVHFDDEELYVVGGHYPNTVDLMWVATHELGHTLGLEHSNVEEAVMYPYYSRYKKEVDLASDDIVGIQTLYGGKVRKPKSKTKKTIVYVKNIGNSIISSKRDLAFIMIVALIKSLY